MEKTTLTGVLVGEPQRFSHKGYQRAISSTFRTFYAMDVKTEIDRENGLGGSALLVCPSRRLGDDEAFTLMCSAPEFPDVSTARKYAYDLEEYVQLTGTMREHGFEVESFSRIRKPRPQVAPIDYDESVQPGKREKEAEYTGEGAGFEL